MDPVANAMSLFKGASTPGPSGNPFRLVSSLSGPATPNEIRAAQECLETPAELVEMWSICRGARLFEDVDYGQWGLVIFDPQAAVARTLQERASRPSEYRLSDIVIGGFLGDQELLVVAPSEVGERRVMVALPLDTRSDWFGAARGLAEFLEAYFMSGGEKYWERRSA